jgi:hypothetical protein
MESSVVNCVWRRFDFRAVWRALLNSQNFHDDALIYSAITRPFAVSSWYSPTNS